MAGPVLIRRSSSSSPGLIGNLLSRAFSAATLAPPSRKPVTKASSKLAKAQSSKYWDVFKSWMSEYNKHYESDEEMVHRFGIFTNTLKIKEKWHKEISRHMLGLNRFSDDLKYIGKMNKKIDNWVRLNVFPKWTSTELSLLKRRHPKPSSKFDGEVCMPSFYSFCNLKQQ